MADDAHPEWRSETRAVRAGRTYDEGSLAPVLWPSTTYFNQSVEQQHALALSAHPAKFYSRNGSPSVLGFEDAVAALEGAEAALAFASGMGAISTVVLAMIHATADRWAAANALLGERHPRRTPWVRAHVLDRRAGRALAVSAARQQAAVAPTATALQRAVLARVAGS